MSSTRTISLATTVFFTLAALIAFAANSVLCRMALREGDGSEGNIDAVGFTLIRLLSGAIVLYLILKVKSSSQSTTVGGSWFSALMLFLYAICFSFAYRSLDTGTGALVLFGSVQFTIIFVSLLSGTRLHLTEWLGVLTAFGGFVYLVLPSVTTPSFAGFLLMAIAGAGWGFYTLRGRGSNNPLADTAANFTRTVPMVVLACGVTWLITSDSHFTARGILLAAISGAIASGIGYTLWYTALGGLSATEAAVVQLSVPIIAAAGAFLFAGESIGWHLVVAAYLILGGILTVILGRLYFVQPKKSIPKRPNG